MASSVTTKGVVSWTLDGGCFTKYSSTLVARGLYRDFVGIRDLRWTGEGKCRVDARICSPWVWLALYNNMFFSVPDHWSEKISKFEVRKIFNWEYYMNNKSVILNNVVKI